MEYPEAILRFQPGCAQEAADRETILWYGERFGSGGDGPGILSRENRIAHLTSSGFLLNAAMDKTLMVHHNIYNTWAWTGGHADGDPDLLAVALREAEEETGVSDIRPLCGEALSLDILPVWGHVRRGEYVGCHLHLSAAYVLIAPEDVRPVPRPEENSGVKWIPLEELEAHCREPEILPVYRKLIRRAWALGQPD